MTLWAGSLCSGYGGLDLAVRAVLGGKLAWVADTDPGASAILAARFPGVPNLGDISAADWESVPGVDVLTAGFPCFPAGTRILTERGFVPIEVVQTGDLVLTHLGRWRPVTSTMRRHAPSTRIIRGQGFPDIVTTDEHPFYTRQRERVWDQSIRRWRSFLADDPQWTPAEKLEDHHVGQVLPVEDLPIPAPPGDVAYTSAFWWLVGRYLADGWRAVSNGKGRVVICAAFKEAEEVERRIREVYPCTPSRERTVTKFHITRTAFHSWLAEWGSGAAGKLIPGWALGLSQDDARSLLEGYSTGDGSVTYDGGWKATTISRSLALGIALLAQRAYGVVASIHQAAVPATASVEGRAVNQQPQYQVVVPMRNRSAVVDGAYGWKKIRSNRVTGPACVFNISVADDESYVADGVIVHNCQDVSCAGARKGLRAGTRTGVWSHVAEAIAVLRPPLVLLENVRGLLSAGADSNVEPCPWCLGDSGDESALRALGAVLGDLADLGFDAEWQVVSAADAGAPHRRERVFILAWPADADSATRGRHKPGSRPGAIQGPAVAERAPEQPGRLHSGDRGTVPVAVQDADRATGDQRGFSAPGQAESGRPRADAGRSGGARAAADADSGGRGPLERHVRAGESDAGRGSPADPFGSGRDGRSPDEGRREERGTAARRRGEGVGAAADAGGARLREYAREPPAEEAGAIAGDVAGDHHGERAAGDGWPATPDADGDGLPRSQERDGNAPHGQPERADRRVDPLGRVLDWGPYGPAVRRWEHATGRPAPRPTERGRTGERLSPAFVEWMQGLPEGWVTGLAASCQPHGAKPRPGCPDCRRGLSRNAQLKALGNGVVPQQAELALRLLLERSGLLGTESAA